jgi:hypothetical protein
MPTPFTSMSTSWRVAASAARSSRPPLAPSAAATSSAPRRSTAFIEHLRKLASPESLCGICLGEVQVNAVREYGGVLAARRLWEELGLDRLLGRLPHAASIDLEEAVFRMVANRLCDPTSKLGLVNWTDEHGVRHRG